MKNFATQRPALFALMVLFVLEVIVIGALLLSNLAGIPLLALDLPILLLNAIFAVILIGVMGWWKETGFNAPSQWKNGGFIIVPLALLIVPTLFFQPQFPPLNRAIVLAIVTLLIGFQEEAIFRGILLSAFRPQGVMKAVLISAALFGVIHINSLLVGRDPIFVLAQIVASFFGAIGLGALRVRMNTVVPLVLLHAFNDFLQFSATGGMEAGDVSLTIPILKVVVSALMAVYGLYLLREYKEEASE
ncbi:MAG: abortive infection protein [Chloroflexus sp.]|uniref:CPBP family intramembrane glutamic endopeptidase n=1 Tax=Chloroflexus sp. TaxID=1904827 RepID=UPI0021DBCE3F|nr:CPBP family intramembrane glutamic endopeptidase [Chloroflexus sp.]GIV91044.1 MAG: abortive infection protein [Chloroflexus sp.]